MNPLIKELALQAGFQFGYYNKDIIFLPGLNPGCEKEIEKFAQLLVKDIITTVAAQALLNESALAVFKNLNNIYVESSE